MKYLLDTDTCVTFLRQGASLVATHLASESFADIALCAVVKAELLYGVRRSKRSETELPGLMAFLGNFVSLPFDDQAAEVYAHIRASLATSGTPIGPNDLLIAAIALSRSLTLVTHNTREFSRVPSLLLADWAMP